LKIIESHFAKRLNLNKKKVLISAGPTHEKIDPVRYIGNNSTGKMGFCLAIEAASRGASVTLIAGPVALSASHPNITRIDVETADEMYVACMREAPMSDIIIMAAAVADYTCNHQSPVKLKKGEAPLSLEFIPTRDILKDIGKNRRKNQVLVGFALETDHELEHAKNKLISKNLDYIVLNSLKEKGAGFGLETNKISIIDRKGEIYYGKLNNKPAVASEIIDYIVKTEF
jgi:phosphopantothenoylcysteine decarboxylase/phosphopantothenate--cysteine ligase